MQFSFFEILMSVTIAVCACILIMGGYVAWGELKRKRKKG